jgi:predicted enzyme related to lactoylglutathione lyase
MPVSKSKVGEYQTFAEKMAALAEKHGALEYVNSIADDVKLGKVTSFPQAVKLAQDEVVVRTLESREIGLRCAARRRSLGSQLWPNLELRARRMTHRGLIGAVVYANDLSRLVEFYSSIAGLTPYASKKGFAILGSEPSQLVIVRVPRRVRTPLTSLRLPIVFAVEDIARARDRAVMLGGAMNGVEREWEFEGAKVCDGHDPEGNVFQLRQTA